MRIRPAQPEESAKCAEIHTEARANVDYLHVLHSPEETLAWMRDVVFENDSVIVAEGDGGLVGYASYANQVVSNMYVLPRSVNDYVAYYNRWRPHRSFDQNAPCLARERRRSGSRIVAEPVLGSLHHIYRFAA